MSFPRTALILLFSFAIAWFGTVSLEKACGDEPTPSPASSNPDVWVTSIATHPSGLKVAGTASGLLLQGADVVKWEGGDFAKRTVVMSHPAAVWCVRVCDDGSHVASTDYRGNLQVFDASTNQATMFDGAFERWTQALRYAPGTETIVAGNEAGKFFIWDNGKVTKSIDVDKHAITDIAFNQSADTIALSDGAGTVHLFSWPALESKGKLKIGDSPAWCVAFTLDSTAVLVGSGDRMLYRCEAKEGAEPKAILKGTDWITRIAVSSAGSIAIGEVGGKVYVVNDSNNDVKEIAPIGTAPSGVWAVQWETPSRLLVGTRKDGIVALAQAWTFVTEAAGSVPVVENQVQE